MDLNYRIIDDKEEKIFDEFVKNHPKGHILQSYAWGEVKGKTGWKPIRLVVENKGNIVASALILKRSLPFLRKSIFYIPRGPVLDYKDQKVFDFLLNAIKELAKKEKAILLKIDPDIPSSHEDIKEILEKRGFKLAVKAIGFEGIQPKYVFRLDLRKPLEEIRKNFHPKTRYNIGLAQRKGVEIKNDCSFEDLSTFYKILEETALRDHFLIRSYNYFVILWKELVERGYAKLFLAYYKGKAIAGTLAFIFGDKAWYVYGASSNEYRNVMPNYLLQWTMICWAYENGCNLYDFRGIPGNVSEKHHLYGLYRFKKGFGGTFTEFIGEYDLIYSPFYYFLWKIAKKIYNLYRMFLFVFRKNINSLKAKDESI